MKYVARLSLPAILCLAALPAVADTQFHVKRRASGVGPGECNLRLQVKTAATITVQGEQVTVSGDGARNLGSECTRPLPEGEIRGFHFEGAGVEAVKPPAVFRVPRAGQYSLRLTWNTGPEGFSWNNAVRYQTKGSGEARVGGKQVALGGIEVAMDLGGKVVVTFGNLSFIGVVNHRDPGQWRADVVCDGPEWHVQGPMFLTIDPGKERVTAATLEATDGHDRMSLHWSYGKRVSPIR